MKPYVGLIVLYRDKMDLQHDPALVQAVNKDGTVDLTVFHTAGHAGPQAKVKAGDDPGQWSPVKP